MAALGRNELRKALELLLKEMQRKGMVLNVSNTNSIVDNIVDKVGKQVTSEKLHTPEMKKALMVCLMSEVVASKNTGIMFDYSKLFNDNRDTPMPQLKKELKEELSKLYKALNELTPDAEKLSEKDLDMAVDKITEVLMDKFKKQDEASLAENQNTMNYILDAFAEALNAVDKKLDASKEYDKAQEESMRSLFGTNLKAGYIQVPVRAIIGNLTGIADVSGANNPTSGAAIDEMNSYQGHEDPHGIENTVRERLETISNTIDNELTAEGVYSTAPKNLPGGFQ